MTLFGELIALPITVSIGEGIVPDEINKLQKSYLSINVTLLMNLPIIKHKTISLLPSIDKNYFEKQYSTISYMVFLRHIP